MSLDRRLRDNLDRIAAQIEPDVEARLQASVHAARQRSRRRRATAVLAFAAVVLGIVFIGPAAWDTLRNSGLGVGSDGSPAPEEDLSGRYSTIIASDDAELLEHQMNGDWTIEFRNDGILGVAAPSQFVGTRTGYSFELTADQLRTDLFSADVCSGLVPGTYRWELVGDVVTFTVVEDPCTGRAALLTMEAWRAATGPE
jgi:hypothetical protein